MSDSGGSKKALGITCDRAECEKGLHAFRPGRGKLLRPEDGCKYCGQQAVDWSRVHRRDLSDFDAIVRELQNEWIRHHFWTVPIDFRAIRYAEKKGRVELRNTVVNRIRRSIGVARPFRDGGQTPIDGERLAANPVFYAQHATASCCRKCAEYWWGIERGRPLTEDQVGFFTDLCMRFLIARIPSL